MLVNVVSTMRVQRIQNRNKETSNPVSDLMIGETRERRHNMD